MLKTLDGDRPLALLAVTKVFLLSPLQKFDVKPSRALDGPVN
ncbi:hypothetical protein [Amycolatopsis sp. NPDC052450]